MVSEFININIWITITYFYKKDWANLVLMVILIILLPLFVKPNEFLQLN